MASTMSSASPAAVKARILAELSGVSSWKEFLDAPIRLVTADIVDEATRSALDALPSSVRLLGDTLALEYALEGRVPVVILRLREGQARRLRASDLPRTDRALRLEVLRGRHAPLRAASLAELDDLLREVEHHPARRRSPDAHLLGQRHPIYFLDSVCPFNVRSMARMAAMQASGDVAAFPQ